MLWFKMNVTVFTDLLAIWANCIVMANSLFTGEIFLGGGSFSAVSGYHWLKNVGEYCFAGLE